MTFNTHTDCIIIMIIVKYNTIIYTISIVSNKTQIISTSVTWVDVLTLIMIDITIRLVL